jgi:hypothetical protein
MAIMMNGNDDGAKVNRIPPPDTSTLYPEE